MKRENDTRNVKLVAVLLMLCLTVFPLLGQETDDGSDTEGAAEAALPRVLVIPFVNATGQPQNDAVASTTSDTIGLTVELLGQYQAVEMPELTPEQAGLPLEELAAGLAEELAVESVLFGRVTRDDDGVFDFSLSVYDRQDQAVTTTTETESTSLFGVFDAADELVAEAVSAFSGVRVGFGSLRFTPDGSFRYRVYLDGSLVGEDIRALDRVLIGTRIVRITQLVADIEREIYRETLEIEEGDNIAVAVEAPEATEAEIVEAQELSTRIRERLNTAIGLETVPGDLEQLERIVSVAPAALDGGPAALAHLQARYELVGMIPEMVATDFTVPAYESAAAARDAVRVYVDPLSATIDEILDSGRTDSEAQELVDDARRSGAVLYNLLVLRRAAADRDETELIERLNVMLSFSNNRMVRLGRMVAPYNDATNDSRRFAWSYNRAMRRRRPFWHWFAGTVGAAGFLGGTYLQLVQMPLQRDTIDEEYDRYQAAITVEDATDARSSVEQADTLLSVYEIASYAGFASGVLVPIALYSRVRSLTRPGRVWRDHEDSPFRTSVQATAIDVKERRWEEGEPAVLIVGEDEQITVGGTSESRETPVYVPFDDDGTISVTHDTAMLGARESYTIPRTLGLTVLYVGTPEVRE